MELKVTDQLVELTLKNCKHCHESYVIFGMTGHVLKAIKHDISKYGTIK
jgi:hypothetical protein